MISSVIVLLAFSIPCTHATIVAPYDCATNLGSGFNFDANAVACDDSLDDAICKVLFQSETLGADPYPTAGQAYPRPLKCHQRTAGIVDADLVAQATELCPKTCGFCCKNSAYTCRNKEFPRIPCSTVTPQMCRSMLWRNVIAEDCPAVCGLCNEGGCVDAAMDCDPSNCNTIGLEDFVNLNCRRTCGRCTNSTTVAPGVTVNPGSGSCTSYIADSSTACRSWAANGFCTNNFYTAAQRRNYCATTCRIC